ncbi:AgmX/PglI C-terminal domain-containing protein [Vulgatibacter incomptus]|uniref:FHA domain-containing protein n=1 Tax=Vulgatibacter incomptus TaxID=1391653 RepID=A0A0K1PFB9_9BACT|nr:AgmX/PglI C-terminal domain-containing protein [Vulgatibacter incomptus]AKU92131.1 hypothetical protein AKJ08_2518 [Vulgatibacter incomptus]
MFSGIRPVTVGRASDAGLRLEDPLVSGRHAVLFVQDGRLWIGDDGSSHGLFVNGRRVATAPIGPLDEIRLGDSRIKVEPIVDEPAHEAPPPMERTQTGLELTPALERTQTGRERPAPVPPASEPPVPAAVPSNRPVANAPAAPVDRRAALGPSDQGSAARPPLVHGSASHGVAANDPVRSAKKSLEAPPPVVPEKNAVAPKATAAREVAEEGFSALPYPTVSPEVDEDEEAERRFSPPFSLLETVVRDGGDPGAGAALTAEVLRHRGDRLVEQRRLERGESCEVVREADGQRWQMFRVLAKQRIRVFFREGDEGTLRLGGAPVSLASFCDDGHLHHKKRRIYAVELAEGDSARLVLDGATYDVRWVRSPAPPPKKWSFRVSPEDRRYGVVGVAGIALMLIGIWVQALLAPPELLVMEEQAQFAEITLKDLEMEKPPEPPKPPEPIAEVQAPEPQATPEPTPEPQKPAPAAPRPAKASPGRQRAAPAAAPAPSAADSALAALEGIGSPGPSKVAAAVSNIAAVRAPSGSSSSFQVSGAIGKVPGDEVTLSRGGKAAGGGGGRETRAAATLLAGSNVGKVAGGGGTGQVRGTVARQPPRSVGTSGGSLSREAIAKVINEGIARVQSCYERQLISNPGLQGKLVFDWVIAPSGAVESTRVRSSSLANEAVATCVAQVIKSWRFPEPTGGSVTVTFPFVFNVQGF